MQRSLFKIKAEERLNTEMYRKNKRNKTQFIKQLGEHT
jgi:hypothetical protein